MNVWVDAQLSPRIARWLTAQFDVRAMAVGELGLRDAADREIFETARAADAVVMTKDVDFVTLLERHGPPPKVIWVTTGNTSNQSLRRILANVFQEAMVRLDAGEPLVEIR